MLMKFTLSSLLEYEVTVPVTFLLSVRASQGQGQEILREHLQLPGGLEHRIQTCIATSTRFDRIHAAKPGVYTIRYEAEVEVQSERFPARQLEDAGPESFETNVLPYLYPSRYCQSDRLGRLTFDMFGDLPDVETKVRAVVEWIFSRLSYVSGSTDAGTSAVDSLVERAGVCRDFAHLGIALCRAMNIPARYFTGYAHDLNPPDFHACFETWTGQRWLFWDPTRLASPDGVVRIATGRDASDCSICTSFGPLSLQRQEVLCSATEPGYAKMSETQIRENVISLVPE